jgi:hypothetical protein
MGVFEQFILTFAEDSVGSTGVYTAIGIEPSSEEGGFFIEDLTVNDPGREGFEGMAVQTSNLMFKAPQTMNAEVSTRYFKNIDAC